MNFPDCLHKGLLGEIIHRRSIDFIEHDKDGHQEQRRAITTVGKGGYTAAVHNIYSVPSNPPEEHHETVNNLNTIV